MSLLENQTFKKQLKFIDINDENKTLSFNISLQCNHDVDKEILNEIENTINKLILINYMPEQKFREQIKLQKENEKLQEKNQKLQQKLQQQNEKLQQKLYEQQMKEQNKIINNYKCPPPPPKINKQNEPAIKKVGMRTLE